MQRGVQYVEAEIHAEAELANGASSDPSQFTPIVPPLSIIDAVTPEIVEAKRQTLRPQLPVPPMPVNSIAQHSQQVTSANGPGHCLSNSAATTDNISNAQSDGSRPMEVTESNGSRHDNAENISSTQVAMLPCMVEIDSQGKPDSSAVVTLRGHESEVFICAWNPQTDLLASGSGDSTARIWDLTTPTLSHVVLRNTGAAGVNSTASPQHDGSASPSAQANTNGGKPNKDVTSLDWSRDGKRLATGSYDGCARVWSVNGQLQQLLTQHRGPIFALKWNRTSRYLLSAGVDKTTAVWDASTGRIVQQFALHSAPALDVDWQSEQTFASCSTDKLIFVCEIGQTHPIKTFRGHTNEVNAIKWSPEATLLASCSDDMTLKVWTMSRDNYLHDLKGHEK